MKLLSRVRLLATPWTAAHQAPLSMGFSSQEYWSGVPLPSLLQMLETSKSNWKEREVVDIEVDWLCSRCHIKTSFLSKHETLLFLSFTLELPWEYKAIIYIFLGIAKGIDH